MKLEKYLGLLAILALTVFLSACNDKAQSNATNTRTITDMTGRKVVINKDIKSVVTLGSVPVINSFVMALGEQDKIANSLPAFAKMPKWKYQYIFAPKMKDKPRMQGDNLTPDIEKIIKAKPDLILTMHPNLVSSLTKRGLKVVVLKWRNIGDVKPMMELLGTIFNKQAQAQEYLKYFNFTLDKANKLTANIKDKKRVLYISLSCFCEPHLISSWWIKSAGGISVTADIKRSQERFAFSMEQLLSWNPDILIVSKEKDREVLLKDERYKTLKAVMDKQIFLAPIAAHLWANRTIEQPLMVLWALNKFYPDLYSQEDLLKAVKYFYLEFFKTKLSDEQALQIIKTDY